MLVMVKISKADDMLRSVNDDSMITGINLW